jgi:hypothetical protein
LAACTDIIPGADIRFATGKPSRGARRISRAMIIYLIFGEGEGFSSLFGMILDARESKISDMVFWGHIHPQKTRPNTRAKTMGIAMETNSILSAARAEIIT